MPTPTKPRAVFDASPLVFLDGLGYLDRLPELYEVFVTPTVAAELDRPPHRPGAGVAALSWVTVQAPAPDVLETVTAELQADAGEQTAIALATQLSALLVTDDAKARRFAETKDLTLTGTLGILLRLHRLGQARRTLQEDLDVLARNGMRMSEELREVVLAGAE